MEMMRYMDIYSSWRLRTSPLMRFISCFSYLMASFDLRSFCKFKYSLTRIAAISIWSLLILGGFDFEVPIIPDQMYYYRSKAYCHL